MARAPVEDRRREDVVEDLVAAAVEPPRRRWDRSEDADVVSRQVLENGRHRGFRLLRVVRQVGDRVRDLRPRRRDELAENHCRHVLLGRFEGCHRFVEMRLDDPLRAAQPLERLEAEGVRP